MAALRFAPGLVRLANSSFLRLQNRGLASLKQPTSLFAPLDAFPERHIGPDDDEAFKMLSKLGYDSMDAFVADTVPPKIRVSAHSVDDVSIPSFSESELNARAKQLGGQNKPFKSYIGMGYHCAVVPPVILRNVMENPAWYTPYTPYQPEIAQGRLESLVNFQTMVMSLTAMDIANASLLDEATAAAEGMVMAFVSAPKKRTFVVDQGVTSQTIAVLRTRAKGFGINVIVGDASSLLEETQIQSDICGVLVQYPDVDGNIKNFGDLAQTAHSLGALVICATDLLALTKIKPPGEWGADVVVGNSARFGVPAGYGGPHAAFFAVTDKLKRKMPGRLIGRSRDTQGNLAYRLSLQTREQHIRREKATSNICTSQALLANMAAMYAVYHGPAGLQRIATKVHKFTEVFKTAVIGMGYKPINSTFFDTITLEVSAAAGSAEIVHAKATDSAINLRHIDNNHVGITLDESVSPADLLALVNVFASAASKTPLALADLQEPELSSIPVTLQRTSEYLPHPVFNKHHSETEMLRYIHHLASKDLGLVHSMIPLGSCTMKLNSTSSMIPLTWPEFSSVHPFAPYDQVQGYHQIIKELEDDLCKITGFHAASLQPNSGAAGEYAGLSVIRAYHESRNEGHRDICLIPLSAHGTNPASAAMAGLKVVAVKVHADGNLDLEDLQTKAEKHKDKLAAFMITYPSTFGVFEAGVQDACKIIHDNGGQVYLDGANLNAQIGITNPATCGGDVCHMNLHKTFAIPHGGGGPGVGPICVAEHLAPFLPSHPAMPVRGAQAIEAVSAAPFGSASINLISWAYIKMLGGSGLVQSSKIALLNANYMASRLQDYYTLRYKNENGRVAHELLIDLAEFDKAAGLKDYGFHPPTCSWPIQTCMLIEPTESETLDELDRFCDAMISIRKEAEDIITGKQPKDNNLLKNAPHPVSVVIASDKDWNKPYSREQAAYPLPWLKEKKFWPTVSRIDDAYGDLNLICDCPTVEEMTQ
ncbi:Putative glycine dehydrogenase (decarboxylating), mitochondrial [Psilocybe cubensis]|uniref:Glycine cleavage system P protein n=2 Tax=Psilocybe cubensis TaxID=181762 RepID=A0A8H8CRA4_PSICU|nr:Putative glycine dehydrogenase (decarboxylating), mitochondrial [Psilocybe cubensis]KAH9486508.1 Putative glycine dehydrogenase (decarboxylating), mitochondrial [Psilocybe cubensis]